MKTALGLIAGIAAAFALIMAVELASRQIWPWPAGLDFKNPEIAAAAMAQVPLGALIAVAVAWTLGAFGGSWVGATVARKAWPGFVPGALVIMGAVANLVSLPHPVWFWPVALLVVPLVTIAAARLGAGRRPETPAPATPSDLPTG